MEIECPKCEKISELDGDDLPSRACDTNHDYECKNHECQNVFSIGWYAEAEIR